MARTSRLLVVGSVLLAGCAGYRRMIDSTSARRNLTSAEFCEGRSAHVRRPLEFSPNRTHPRMAGRFRCTPDDDNTVELEQFSRELPDRGELVVEDHGGPTVRFTFDGLRFDGVINSLDYAGASLTRNGATLDATVSGGGEVTWLKLSGFDGQRCHYKAYRCEVMR